MRRWSEEEEELLYLVVWLPKRSMSRKDLETLFSRTYDSIRSKILYERRKVIDSEASNTP